MNKTARRLFPAWADVDNIPPMLAMLAAFAAKRPGVDPADYGAHWKQSPTRETIRFYNRDCAAITRQLQQVRRALAAAYAAQVTDQDLIEASKGDRLTVTPDGLDYTTGQYFPLEYRPAVARVIERAARKAQERAA
jgi:hypothetical protein